MKKLLPLFCLLLFLGCNTHKDEKSEILVTFIPCNNFPMKYIYDTEVGLGEYLEREFNIHAHIEWDDVQEKISKKGKRYDAEKVIRHFQSDSLPLTIVFMNEDIEQNGKGILGLSIHPNCNTCVVSTYRLKNKKDLWKLVAHEFIHTYFDYSHCPDDNPTCIMQDAKGKVNFKNKNQLCPTCKQNIMRSK